MCLFSFPCLLTTVSFQIQHSDFMLVHWLDKAQVALLFRQSLSLRFGCFYCYSVVCPSLSFRMSCHFGKCVSAASGHRRLLSNGKILFPSSTVISSFEKRVNAGLYFTLRYLRREKESRTRGGYVMAVFAVMGQFLRIDDRESGREFSLLAALICSWPVSL